MSFVGCSSIFNFRDCCEKGTNCRIFTGVIIWHQPKLHAPLFQKIPHQQLPYICIKFNPPENGWRWMKKTLTHNWNTATSFWMPWSSEDFQTQTLNVWYIYLHLPSKLPKCRYTNITIRTLSICRFIFSTERTRSSTNKVNNGWLIGILI